MSTQRVYTVQQADAKRRRSTSISGLFSQVDSWVTKGRNETASGPLRESATIRHVLTNADPNDVERIEGCEGAALRDIISKDSAVASKASRVILDAALYYENIGNFGKSISLTTDVLNYAITQEDFLLQRRTYGLLGALYSRVSDFEAAFLHSAIACDFARRARRPEEIIPAFANAALILYAAGLSRDAHRISLAISCLPSGNSLQDYAHMINGMNGIRLSHQIGDAEAADYFFSKSRGLFKKQEKHMTGVSRAYYEAYTAEHFIVTGKENRAIVGLERALGRTDSQTNVRVLSLLNCALAKGYLAVGNFSQLATCKKRLISLMSLPQLQWYHLEEILKVLIDITKRDDGDLASGNNIFARQLQILVVEMKYKQFFANVAKSYAKGGLTATLERPTYAVPDWVKRILSELNCMTTSSDRDYCVRSDIRYASLARPMRESKLRSPQYEVAEDWAVAADLLNGGNGQHCFAVGELVRMMARQLGVDSQKAAQMALAARLHDIGSIATVKAAYDGVQAVPLGEFGTARLHCEVGEKLLGGVSQPVLQMAARIAAAHHEWWNGHGLPRGLRGESIPLEARLCSVADTYLSLRKPKSGMTWSEAPAADQIKSMAGVQLDPSIVGVLIKIVEASDHVSEGYADVELKKSGLLRAKKALFTILELS